MSMAKNKISAFQFYALLFLMKLLTTITHTPSNSKGVMATDTIISAVLGLLFVFIVSLPLMMLLKKNKDKSIVDIAFEKNDLLGKILSAFCCIVLFYYTITNLLRLDLFTGSIVFPETNVNYFIVFVVLVCGYGAYMGFEALGRSAVLSLVPVLTALAFVFFTLFCRVNYLNFTPPLESGVYPVLSTALGYTGRMIELLAVALLFPYVSGERIKGFYWWMGLQTFVTFLFFFFKTGVMGDFASSQLFPMHSLSALAEFAMFKRLDALITGIWLICAFLKISVFIFLQMNLLMRILPKAKKEYILIIICVVTAIVVFFSSDSIERYLLIDNNNLKTVFVGISVFLIPLIFLASERVKKCLNQ